PAPRRSRLGHTQLQQVIFPAWGARDREQNKGGGMESGHAVTAISPVLSAGGGVRDDNRWALRMGSFRLGQSYLGSAAARIVTTRSAAATALIGLLSGRIAPGYGGLHVLGYDMSKPAGGAAVRRQSGTATPSLRPLGAAKIRALVDRAARHSGQPGSDRHLL